MNVNDSTPLLHRRSVLKKSLQLVAVSRLDPFTGAIRAERKITSGKTVESSSARFAQSVGNAFRQNAQRGET